MSRVADGWRMVRAIVARRALERRLDEELRFHLEQQTAKNVRAGMSPGEARRRALVRFGGLEHARGCTRDELRAGRLEDWLRDLRGGLRSLRRSPRFAVVAILTLGLGIGAATTVFSVVHGVLIKPLPYPASDRLVSLAHTAPGATVPVGMGTSATQFFTYRDEARTFEQVGVWSTGVASVTGTAEPEEVRTLIVTHGTLQALGVHPASGRWFSPADDAPGAPGTVILMHGFWQRRYGGDPSVLGRALTVDGRPRQILGVMPDGFRFLDTDADIVVPQQFDRAGLVLRRLNLHGLALLAPGVTLSQANADVARMIPIWLKAWPAPPGIDPAIFERARFTPALRPLKQDVVGDVGPVLWVLMGTVGIVLLIACANVANLLLVRAEGRQQELAMRAALGASAGRLARELLLESLVLTLTGGVLGLGLSFAALRLLVAAAPANLPRLAEVALDPIALAFALGLSVISGVVFGVIPVARHAGAHLAEALRGGGRTSSQSRERHRVRDVLVVGQVALALVLLVGSGLMVRTFQALRAVQPGFTEPDTLQLVRLSLPRAQVQQPVSVLRAQQDIRDRLAAVPGVTGLSFISAAPMEPDAVDNLLLVEDRAYAGQVPPDRRFKFVAPGFFATAGVRLVAGRDLSWADLEDRRTVAIVSENLARELWREPALALGRRIRANTADPWREIVGVVADVHDDGVQQRAPATVYWPILMERFWRNDVLPQRSATFVIRSARAGSDSFLDELQAAVWRVNASLPLAQVRTLGEVSARSLARTSFTLIMLATAGGGALLLGLVGIYGVIAYAVGQRTREIGIRVALGARPAEVKRMFVAQGLRLAAMGVACGMLAAWPLTRLMDALLFGIGVLDPLTYGAVVVALAAAAAMASYLPAHRAAAIDPIDALRAD